MRVVCLLFLLLVAGEAFGKRKPAVDIASYSTKDKKIVLHISELGDVRIDQRLAPDSLAIYKWQERVAIPEDVVISPKLSYVFMVGNDDDRTLGRGRIRVYNFQGDNLREIKLKEFIPDFEARTKKCGKTNPGKWFSEIKLIASTDRILLRLCDRKTVAIPLATLSPEWH